MNRKEEQDKLRAEGFRAGVTMAEAISQAGGTLTKSMLQMPLEQFLIEVALPNGIWFFYDPNHGVEKPIIEITARKSAREEYDPHSLYNPHSEEIS